MRWAALLCASFSLMACAALMPESLMGRDEADVLRRMGHPSAIVPMPEGVQRWQYTSQPFGRTAWMVDLDARQRVVQVRQTLNTNDLQSIPVDGSWGAEEVLREFGPPGKIDTVASWEGEIWNYRWRDVNADMFYWIYFDPQGRVRRAHQGMDMTRDRPRSPFLF